MKTPKTRTPKFTPGPWDWEEFADGQILVTSSDDPCLYVADLNTRTQDPEGRYPNKHQRIGNAKLIAASPKLYAAACAVLDNWERGDLAAAVRELAAVLEEVKP